MEQTQFNELMNKGIVTNVGLDANKYIDIADLQNKGYATAIGAKKVYDEIVSKDVENTPVEEPVEEPTEPVESPETVE